MVKFPKQNRADVWVSSTLKLESNENSYYLVEAIEQGEVGLRKIAFGHQSQTSSIDKNRLEGWRRACGNPYCARGIETLIHEGVEFEGLRGNTRVIDNKLSQIVGQGGERILIAGGHYIPDLEDFAHSARQPYKALKEALKIVEIAYNQGKRPDVLVFVNDLHMGNEDGSKNRRDYFKDYQLPDDMKELTKEYRQRMSFSLIVAGERKLSDKLQRDRKKLLRKDALERGTGEEEGNYYADVDGERKLLISHKEDNPQSGYLKCLAACTRLIEMAREMGYSRLIQVYPVCASGSVEPAVKLHRTLYGGGIGVTNVYRTVTCFADTDSIRALPPKE